MAVSAALIQMTSSDDPVANLKTTRALLREAADRGAQIALTPEVTNCISLSRALQAQVLQPETEDLTLAGLREEARALGIWVLIGSLALKAPRPGDGPAFLSRSYLIDPQGEMQARYDKIHMFDVQVSETETYRESAAFQPGNAAVVAPTPFGVFGLSICYDLRFAYLYRALAQAGAEILSIPAAFSPVTGIAHWEVLLRARAIETGCFVLAPAQCGRHPAREGRRRGTYGHSLAVAPWGEVLLDMDQAPGVGMITLDLDRVQEARAKVPALTHDRSFTAPRTLR